MESEILGVQSSLHGKQYQVLHDIISSGTSKQFLGRKLTLEDLDSMDEQRLLVNYKIFELNDADRIRGEFMISGIISVYSKAVNKVLPIDDINELQDDLNNDYILTRDLKNMTGAIEATCGNLMSLFSIGLTTFRHMKLGCKEGTEVNDQCTDNSDVAKCSV
jgi:hypothetical protein